VISGECYYKRLGRDSVSQEIWYHCQFAHEFCRRQVQTCPPNTSRCSYHVFLMGNLWAVRSLPCCTLWLFEVGGNGETCYHVAVATIVCQVGRKGVYTEQSGSTWLATRVLCCWQREGECKSAKTYKFGKSAAASSLDQSSNSAYNLLTLKWFLIPWVPREWLYPALPQPPG